MIDIKSQTQFVVSPRFEVFFALQTLTDAESRIHESWRRNAQRRLPESFHRKLKLIGGSPFLWPVVADVLENISLSKSFEDMVAAIRKTPQRQMQERMFLGILHDPKSVAMLLSHKKSLSSTIAHVARVKREWLAFIGLYPLAKKAPLTLALEYLLRAPGEFQKIVCDLLEIFWNTDFRETWEWVKPNLLKSCEEKERLFQSCSLAEFARLALLRVEIDERKGLLKAIRGGAKVPFKALEEITVLPSAFNDKRHWTCYGSREIPAHAYFPYFDPAISLSSFQRAPTPTQPEVDPALIFKALGDATRYAMVSLLARKPLTSADLAKAFELSRPTVSHHIHLLREAGLLEEHLQGHAVLLSLKREIFEQLSELVTEKLFRSQNDVQITKTRTK